MKTKMNLSMTYKDYKGVVLVKNKYKNTNNNSLILMHYGEPLLVASVNPDEVLEENEIAIKDYSENEGIYDWLLKNNIIHPYHRLITSGFVQLLVCKVNVGYLLIPEVE